MKKILFLDVDGTIVDYHNRIPGSAQKAIRAARAQGHVVIACTGRSRAEMQDELWDMGLDGMIGGNGSYIEFQGQVLQHQVISDEDARQVVDWLQARGLEFFLESNQGLFASPGFRERGRKVLQSYLMTKGRTADEVAGQEVEDILHGLVFEANLYRDDLNKISFILDSYQDHLDSQAAFPQLEAHTWGGRGEKALFGDLGLKGVNKGQAMEFLLKRLGVDRSQTIAFGDAKIDIPMLDFAEVGVAMGNGGPEILAMADLVTTDVEADGLYKAFQKLGLL